MENLLESEFGSVRPYTRHKPGCTVDDDSCRCPKWIYKRVKATGEKSRTALNTPSWAEALRKAGERYRELDHEIAALLAKEQDEISNRMTVAAACDLWLSRTETKFGKDSSVHSGYRALKKMLVTWADGHGIDDVHDISTIALEKWTASCDWSRLAATTRRQRWGCLRSMFRYWTKRKVLKENPADPIEAFPTQRDFTQGPYSVEQIRKIRESIEQSVPSNLPGKHKAYVTRLRTFIELLVGTGLDVSDACLHENRRIERRHINGKVAIIYRYRRLKTNVPAIIPITESLAKALENVPHEDGCMEGMPFRRSKSTLKHNQQLWSKRVQQVLHNAGVEFVDVPSRHKDGRPVRKDANVKMFRHTSAIRWLVAGHHAEDVAKMLGHKDTEMIKEHYGPWVEDLDNAFIQRVMTPIKRRRQ
jgi:site-specific recombinase XerD